MSDAFYDIDLKTLLLERIPPRLRNERIVAFVNAVATQIIRQYQTFYRQRKASLYQLLITPQVCYLEKLLNDRYDFTARRIRIDDAVWHQAWYLYQDDELKPEPLYQESENNPVWLYSESEAGELKDDFTVTVPSAVDFNENEMKSLLNMYKLAGTHYKIEVI